MTSEAVAGGMGIEVEPSQQHKLLPWDRWQQSGTLDKVPSDMEVSMKWRGGT